MKLDNKKKIQFLDLRSTYTECAEDINAAVHKFLDSGSYILGDEVKKFEHEFKEYTCTKNCIGVANGLDALIILLKALGVGENDKVVVPANTYIATVLAVSSVGATPVFCEPDNKSYNLCPSNLSAIIDKENIKAVIAVHLYGQMADLTKIIKIIHNKNILLIEDAAQAHGATHFGKSPGTLTDGAAFSFYPSKNLGAFGDAGAIVCNNDQVAEECRVIRNYGSEKKYYNSIKGMNSRLDEFHAAILRIKLRHLDEWNARRVNIAKKYLTKFDNLKKIIQMPEVDNGNSHVWHQFVIRTKDRNDFQRHLEAKGIGTSIHYPVPPFQQKAYKDEYVNKYPLSTKMAKQILSLPIGPHLHDDDVDKIISTVLEYF